MPPPDSHSSGFSQGRRWLTTLNLLVATGAALAVVVMINYLAAGHYQRFPWAEATRFKLYPQTLRVLRSLTNDVQVTIFYQRESDVYTMICALLAEYQHANSLHVHVEDLDYVKYPGEAAKLLTRLHLEPTQKDFVAFEGNGRHKICDDTRLSDYNFNDLLLGQEIRRTAFLGELYFTSAILSIAHPRDQKAYFLTGHGERDPDDPAGLGPAPHRTGCAKLAAILKDEMSCDWTNLTLSQTDSIPADCSLLIIPSGREPATGRLSSNELFQVQAYLKNGNARLLALLDTTEGLDPVLSNWGVVLPDTHVIDSDKDFLVGGGEFKVQPALDEMSSSVHPIMQGLARERLTLLMDTPRPIFRSKNTSGDPGAPTLTALATTSASGIQWPPERALTGANGAALPPQKYTLAAAIEQGVINGHDGTRIVVAGDADFLDDQMIDSSANHYFASRTLDWLLSRPEALSGDIGPRPIVRYQLFPTRSQSTRLRWLFLGAMPGAVLFLGGLVWLRRRS